MPPRRPGHAYDGDLRRVLVDATLSLLTQGKDPSLRAVARNAGVAASAPYHHFANREELLACVAAEGFESLTAHLEPLDGDTPSEALRRRVALYAEFAVRHGAHYRVMFDPTLKQEAHPDLDRAARETLAPLVELTATIGRPQDALRVAVDVWAMAHGQVLLYLDGLTTRLLGAESTEDFARRVGDAALRMVEPGRSS